MALPSPLKAELDEFTGEVLESEALRAEGLLQLRVALAAARSKDKKSPPLVRDDDAFLLAFLRARKYEVARAVKCVLMFCAFWRDNAHIIDGLCIAKIRPTYELGFMRMVDTKDVHGNMVQLLDMGKLDYSLFTPNDLVRVAVMLSLTFFGDDNAQVHGVTYVETLKGFTLKKAMTVAKRTGDPENAKVLNMGLDTFPIRIRALYILHQPSFFSFFWGLVKYLFRKKLRDRLCLLGTDLARLHAIVPPAGLPAEFGGTLSETPSAWLDRLEAVERETGMLGGFALPLRSDDPTGARRRAVVAEAAAGGAAVAAGAAAAAVAVAAGAAAAAGAATGAAAGEGGASLAAPDSSGGGYVAPPGQDSEQGFAIE